MSTTSPTSAEEFEGGRSPRVRAILVGGGLVGQVCHLATLTHPLSRIQLAGVVDASLVRARQLGSDHDVPFATSMEQLDLSAADAVIVATPDPTHAELVLKAIEKGLHVFCEKPLGISSAECGALREAADRSGLVCQVGYMKRFDPAVRILIDHMEAAHAQVHGIAVEVRDPDAAPFIKDVPFVRAGDDVPPALAQAGADRMTAVIRCVIGRRPTLPEEAAYVSMISALIHDLNLARLLVPTELRVVSAFYGMAGAQVGMHLTSGSNVHIRLTHTQVPRVADYQELATIYTSRGIYELAFPAPYLLHEPTRLTYLAPMDEHLVSATTSLNDSTVGAFFLSLQAFAERVASPTRFAAQNTFAQATEDMVLLEEALRHAVDSADS